MERLKMRQSLLRPQLMAHADRRLVLLGGTFAAIFALVHHGILDLFVIGAVYSLYIYGCQRLAAYDPYFFDVLLRSWRYTVHAIYPARTPVFYRSHAIGVYFAGALLALVNFGIYLTGFTKLTAICVIFSVIAFYKSFLRAEHD